MTVGKRGLLLREALVTGRQTTLALCPREFTSGVHVQVVFFGISSKCANADMNNVCNHLGKIDCRANHLRMYRPRQYVIDAGFGLVYDCLEFLQGSKVGCRVKNRGCW